MKELIEQRIESRKDEFTEASNELYVALMCSKGMPLENIDKHLIYMKLKGWYLAGFKDGVNFKTCLEK